MYFCIWYRFVLHLGGNSNNQTVFFVKHTDSMNNNDVEKFVNACLEVSSPVFRNNAFYNRIRNLEIDDYRLYYMKAACSYFQESAKKIAKEHIEKALSMIESDMKIGLNCLGCIKINDEKILNALMVPQSFCQLLDVKEYSVFQLAAEIYAELNDYDNSLNMYKKFYYMVNRVAVSKELQDKSEAIVYSFRNYNTYSLEDLINDQITCIHPNKMNDPFDSIASYISNPDILKELCTKEKHIKSQSDCFKHFTIRSFFADRKTYENNDNILFEKLMWSHYADSHKGFCVKYRIKNNAFKQFDDNSETFTRLVPVEYTNMEINIYERLNTDNSFAMKNSVWKHENEVRLVHFLRDCDLDHTSIQLNDDIILEEIILGLNCTKDARKTIAKIVDGKCRLSEIYNDNGKNIYSLKKRDYSSK